MTRTNNVDAQLQRVGERVFNSGPVKRVPARRGMTGLPIVSSTAGRSAGSKRDVRQKLQGIVKRTPQVMVRISGGGKTIGHIKAHVDYISRKGELALEDHQGDVFNGKDDLDVLRDEWQHGGFPIVDSQGVRQAFNIVLSMPAGTDERGLMMAARDFAREEFSNYQYVFALHTKDTDPDPEPSANPHVHLCVKATSLDGTRLNPRKDDLQRWRERFASCLREHGIEAEATRRLHRFQSLRGSKQSVRQMQGRGVTMHSIGKTGAAPDRIAKARQQQADMVEGYRQLASMLASSPESADRELALSLVAWLKGQRRPIERQRDEKLDGKLKSSERQHE